MNNRLEIKDLINTGVFTALYFVIIFASGMLGYIPILMIFLPVYVPILGGIPFMLFITKVKKFGMITIMGTIIGILMFATGHTWVPIITGFISGIIADLIMNSGSYKKFSSITFGYAIFGLGLMGSMLPIWVMRDSYFEHILEHTGEVYAQRLMELTPDWIMYIMFLVIIIAAIPGAYLGRAILKKHFLKAGIV